MPVSTSEPRDDWAGVAPHLESAMDRLGRGERDAVLLRFYRGMSLKEVAATIGISEDAATQRVSRAVAKLRAYFTSRGVNTSGDALTMSVSAHAVTAAPMAVKVAAAATVSAAGAAATKLANGAIKTMAWANVKVAAGIAAVVVITGAAGVAAYNAIAATTPTRTPPPRPGAAAVAPARPPATTAAAPTTNVSAATRPIGARMRATLDRKLPELNFQAIPASDVVDFLRDVTGVNFFVAWPALEARGVPRTRPVTLRLRDVSLAQALDSLLAQLGDQLAYTVDGEVIMIGVKTPESTARLVTVPDAPPANGLLAVRLPEVNFNAIPFSDACSFLRDVTGVKIRVDWSEVQRAGVKRETPVSLRVRDVPLSNVLTLLLESVPTKASGPQLAYTIDARGVVAIGVASKGATRPSTAPSRP
jgi:hypothetical protein